MQSWLLCILLNISCWLLFFFCFFLFCLLEDSFWFFLFVCLFLWVEAVLKSCTTKDALDAAAEIWHRLDTDAVTKWSILPLGLTAPDLSGCWRFFGGGGWMCACSQERKKEEKKLNLMLRKVHDSMVHDCSSTWNNDGIRKWSFMVP